MEWEAGGKLGTACQFHYACSKSVKRNPSILCQYELSPLADQKYVHLIISSYLLAKSRYKGLHRWTDISSIYDPKVNDLLMMWHKERA